MNDIDLSNRKWFIATYVTRVDDISLVGGLRPYKLFDLIKEKEIDATIITRQKCNADEVIIKSRNLPGILDKLSRVFPPDLYVFWAARVGLYLKKHKDFVLFTTSPPNSIHMAGLVLKLLKRDFFWIIDFRDPFLLNDLYKPIFFKHRFNQWFEKQVFKRADLVILNTDLNLESYRKKYPFAGDRMLTVRNGFDDIVDNTATGHFNFIYAGGTSKGLASKKIVALLTAVNKEGINITCDFYGEHDKEVDDCAYTNYKGVILPDEVPQLLKNYKFGFIFLPPPAIGGGRIAQKYYDYIGSGVIPVVINPSLELSNLMEKYKTGIGIYPESTASDIIEAITNASFNMTLEERNEFSRNNQFKKLFSYLKIS